MISGQQIAAIDRATDRVVKDYPPPKYRLNVGVDEIAILLTTGSYADELVDVYYICCEVYQNEHEGDEE